MNAQNYIAIDIAKDTLQVQIKQRQERFTYDAPGLQALLKRIKAHMPVTVVCEATGGYERPLMRLLFENEIPVALVNPARVRAFARSEGVKAKSDPIDTRMLMRFAEQKQPAATKAPKPEEAELTALLDRHDQLTGHLAREKNRLQKSPATIQRSIKKMIRFIEKEIEAIDGRIRKLVASESTMRENARTMQSVVGVGEVTAWAILGHLREITAVGRNQAVALAGLAPYNRDSGKFKGKRRIEGGRAKLRRCLYMAAQSAAVHNPHIKAYVDGLLARGKPYKCAIVAAMRKILLHLQSLLKIPQKCLA
jgi:transposase